MAHFVVKQVVLGAEIERARQAAELELAHIAPAPLGEREAKRLRHLRRQQRQVFVDQLLLQRHGGGGDQHPGIARQGQRDGRRAVGQRLAYTGAGLDHRDGAGGRVLALLGLAQFGFAEGAGHGFGHLPLTGPVAETVSGRDDGVKGSQRLAGKFGGIGHVPSVARSVGLELPPNALIISTRWS
jgi:hypothetical protein